MIQKPQFSSTGADQIPALTGIRFFAIFHIFLFHLWSIYNLGLGGRFSNILEGFSKYPDLLVLFCANGWMATSFFFLLSGFILSYLYWLPNGGLSTSPKEFWIKRFSRIYPIHIIILTTTLILTLKIRHLENLADKINFIGGTLPSFSLIQAWYPPWVPKLSWPTWTLSALVFLYLLSPWLIRALSQLNRRQLGWFLLLMPVISLLPTAITSIFVNNPHQFTRYEAIFISSIPLFWIPHFVAGMVLARFFRIQRGEFWRPNKIRLISAGDIAIVLALVICLLPEIGKEPFKYFMRHGLMMPLYMLIILDLAKNQGLAARFFSLPGIQFLGQTGFSLFVWQNLIMIFCFVSLKFNPALGAYQLEFASIGIVFIGIFSTYKIEQPLAKYIRKYFLEKNSSKLILGRSSNITDQ